MPVRKLCSSSSSPTENIVNISLAKPVPWIPAPRYASVKDNIYSTTVTTLDNGIQVATENKFGQFCTVGGKSVYSSISSLGYVRFYSKV